jgi:lysophospholipase L1-like esterase
VQGSAVTLAFALALLVAVPAAAQTSAATPPVVAPAAAQPAGDRWEKELSAFDSADRVSPFPKGGIVFVGSSTIRRWDLATSFPELRVLNRGLAGSEMTDVVRHVDRLVLKHEPRLVVVYAGDNDIAGGRLAEQVAVEFERFVRAVHTKLPQTRILYLAIKPSILRWIHVDRMRAANELIRATCARDDRLGFVDFDTFMLGWDERPRPELFVADGLHLSPLGYQLWTAALRPLLGGQPSS